MEPETLDLVDAAKCLAILSAIPLVLHALWAEYFVQFLEQLKTIKPDFSPEAEYETARIITTLVLIFEFSVYIGSSEVRAEFPIFTQLILIFSIVILLFTQRGLQKRIGIKIPNLDTLTRTILKVIFLWSSASFIFQLLVSTNYIWSK